MIEDYIPIGQANAIPLKKLCELTGLDSREVREKISLAKRKTCIINLQDGKGYFIPSENETPLAERYIKQEMARSKSIEEALKSAKEFVKNGKRS